MKRIIACADSHEDLARYSWYTGMPDYLTWLILPLVRPDTGGTKFALYESVRKQLLHQFFNVRTSDVKMYQYTKQEIELYEHYMDWIKAKYNLTGKYEILIFVWNE